MDTVYVFVGPTLAADVAQRELQAVYLPPAAQGDVYRVARAGAQAIGIIDGYFERVPAVWHKEILWAMSQGSHVFGSASMGALRAAELAAFGMEGAGWIFEAYRDGTLEDDDEVALAHGPAESGYSRASTPMVNIRRTLARAETEGVLRPETRSTLERLAKELFYPDRDYPRILDCGAAAGLPAAELAALRAWLPGGEVDQKQEDALAMLRLMRARIAAGLPPKRVRYHFEQTVYWAAAQSSSGELHQEAAGGPQTVVLDSLLEELQLEPDTYRQVGQAVEIAALARALAAALGQAVAPEQRRALLEAFRREHDLLEPESIALWLEARGLRRETLEEWLEAQALRRWAENWAVPDRDRELPNYLRLVDAYTRLRARAERKQQALEERGLATAGLSAAGISREELLDWYFVRRAQRAPPRPVPADLARYAQQLGFRDEPALLNALLREFFFSRGGPIWPPAE